MNLYDDGKCSHCGRPDCRVMGDEACQEGRKRFFEEQQRRIEYFEKRQAEKRKDK